MELPEAMLVSAQAASNCRVGLQDTLYNIVCVDNSLLIMLETFY